MLVFSSWMLSLIFDSYSNGLQVAPPGYPQTPQTNMFHAQCVLPFRFSNSPPQSYLEICSSSLFPVLVFIADLYLHSCFPFFHCITTHTITLLLITMPLFYCNHFLTGSVAPVSFPLFLFYLSSAILKTLSFHILI